MRSKNIFYWLVPLLLVQSIAIIILIYYLMDQDKKSISDEEPEVKTEIVSKQKTNSNQRVVSASPTTNQNNKGDTQNSEAFEIAEEAEEEIVSVSESDKKESFAPKSNSGTNAIVRRGGNRNQQNAQPIVDQQLHAANPVNEVPNTDKSIPKDNKTVTVQKTTTTPKKAKEEPTPKQNNQVITKTTPDNKPITIPGKTPGQAVEAAPVYFEIPELKDETGVYSQRTNEGRTEAVYVGGGSLVTEGAVEWALWWLANNQEQDGRWDSQRHEGTAGLEYDLAVTGAAVMAFLSAGKTDTAGEFNLTIQSALKWLVKVQKKDGSWDKRNYSNSICTMAVTEAASMGVGGEEIRKSAVLAMEYILKQQNTSGFFDYTGNTKRDDMSVTGWCVSALKSGAIAGIKKKEIGESYEKLREAFDNSEGLKDISPTTKGLAWYTPTTIGSGIKGGACQAIAMFVSQQIGRETGEFTPWLIAAADGQIATIPKTYAKANVYRVYYAYLALRAVGGKHWEAWNEPVSKILIEAQRLDGNFKGSWDKNGSSIDKAGRVMYTAFNCLCLEIYYRYPTVF